MVDTISEILIHGVFSLVPCLKISVVSTIVDWNVNNHPRIQRSYKSLFSSITLVVEVCHGLLSSNVCASFKEGKGIRVQ